MKNYLKKNGGICLISTSLMSQNEAQVMVLSDNALQLQFLTEQAYHYC